MFETLLEGVAGIKILAQLTRIADALEVLAKIKEPEQKASNATTELLDVTDAEIIAEETEEEQKTIMEILEKNKGDFLWAEDNLADSSDLERLN